MAQNINPVFTKTPDAEGVKFENSDGTSYQTLKTGATDGSLVLSISATTDEASDVKINLRLTSGANVVNIGDVNIPANSGTDGGTTPPVNLLNSTLLPYLQSDGSLILGNGDVLEAAMKTAVTASKFVDLAVFSGDY